MKFYPHILFLICLSSSLYILLTAPIVKVPTEVALHQIEAVLLRGDFTEQERIEAFESAKKRILRNHSIILHEGLKAYYILLGLTGIFGAHSFYSVFARIRKGRLNQTAQDNPFNPPENPRIT